jgi:hypothetical protein
LAPKNALAVKTDPVVSKNSRRVGSSMGGYAGMNDLYFGRFIYMERQSALIFTN